MRVWHRWPWRLRSLTAHVSNTATQTAVGQATTRVSADVSLDCPKFSEGCGGCSLSAGLQQPPALLEARTFFQSRGILLSSKLSDVHGWRCRARLAVRKGPKGVPQVGLFKPGSHSVQPLTSCPLHHPRINEAVQIVNICVREKGISAYDEVPLRKGSKAQPQSSGLLRYLQLTTCSVQGRSPCEADAPVQLVCVVNCKSSNTGATAKLEQPWPVSSRPMAQPLHTACSTPSG